MGEATEDQACVRPGLPLPTTSPATQAGLAPAPHDSSYLRRPQRYHRQVQRVFSTSAMISIQRSPASTAYYDGKRAQGKRHTQAVVMPKARLVPMPPAWTPRCWSSPAAGNVPSGVSRTAASRRPDTPRDHANCLTVHEPRVARLRSASWLALHRRERVYRVGPTALALANSQHYPLLRQPPNNVAPPVLAFLVRLITRRPCAFLVPLVDCVKGNVEQRRNFISREGTFRLSTSRFAGLRHVDRSDCDRRTVRIGAGPQHWRHGPTIRITDPCVRQR